MGRTHLLYFINIKVYDSMKDTRIFKGAKIGLDNILVVL